MRNVLILFPTRVLVDQRLTIYWPERLIGLALMIRRVAPSLMMALALGSAVLQVATYEVAVAACLLYSVLYYTAGNHPNRRVRRASLVVGVVGSAVAAWVYPRVPNLGGVGDVELAAYVFGFIGIVLASVNIFGGFLVTQRMLGMYKKKG